MKYLKAMGIAAFVISLLFLTACGGGDDKKKDVKLILTPGTAPVVIGQPAIFTVGTTNTDFSVSTDKPAAGCVKTSTTTVTCTPTAAGTYELTITATADSKVTAKATITVSELSVSVDISSTSETVVVGQSTSFTITTENTDFEISTSPATGAGCVKINSTLVTCTPTVAGSYTLTVTPTASGKTDTKTATLIVEPKPANIEITNKPTGSVDTWSPIILNVTRADTPAFTVEITSADPSNGISCDTPTADSVTCTPNKAGTYVLTITASADSEKTDTVTITAQEPDGLSVGSAESETKITMVRVEKTGDGTETDKGFLMGCTRNEGQWTSSNCGTSEYRAHTMKLTEDFYIGKYEVTQKLWKHVMGTNPSEVQEFNGAINENLPVTNVHYDDVKEFLDGLNNKGSHATTEYLIPGMKWDFPSDAQWEYAARGGHKPTNCPDELGEGGSNKWGCLYSGNNFQGYVAWYGNSMGGTTAPASGGIDSIHPVGMDKPLAVDASKNSFNELGLYDMSGNVAEWVFDWYEKPNVDSKTDYIVTSGTKRIVRGGNYTSGQTDITVANRPDVFVINPFRTGTTGFRLALISDTEYERRYPTAP